MAIAYGFAHAYEFHYSLFPWEKGGFESRLTTAIDALTEMGAHWWRPHIPWSRVEPRILYPLKKKSDVTEDQVAAYSSGEWPGVDWTETDLWVDAVLRAGIRIHAGLGIAYVSQLPCQEDGSRNLLFTPGVVDPEAYLAHLYLHARATVKRYKDRIQVWQLENELNNAFEIKWFNRWRAGKWGPWGWLTRIMTTLFEAVKQEDPRSVVTHNFSCDAPSLHPLYSWKKDIERWAPFLDWIGVDQYPNYLSGRENHGEKIGRLVAEVRDFLSEEKPVWVLETGIPALPASKGFSEKLQADYYESVLDSVEAAGGQGVLFYCLVSQEGGPGNQWHKRRPWNKVEDHWGLFRPDGNPRQAFQVLKSRFGPRPLVAN